jgi:hypothetical protein
MVILLINTNHPLELCCRIEKAEILYHYRHHCCCCCCCCNSHYRLLKDVKLMKQLQVSSTLYYFIAHWVNSDINKKAATLWGLLDMKMLTVTSLILPM